MQEVIIASRAVKVMIKKKRKVNFEYDLGAFYNHGIEESDSESKLYGIKIIYIFIIKRREVR